MTGWAVETGPGAGPVWLELLADGRVIGTVLADQPRADLAHAGKGQDRGGFAFQAGPWFPEAVICVRRVADGADLPTLHDREVAA